MFYGCRGSLPTATSAPLELDVNASLNRMQKPEIFCGPNCLQSSSSAGCPAVVSFPYHAFIRVKDLWTNQVLSLIKCQELMITTLQSEFPLRVPVCAWCKPKNRGADLGRSSGSISHGICPRHLRKLKLESQIKKDGGHPAPASSRRRREPFNHPQLNYLA